MLVVVEHFLDSSDWQEAAIVTVAQNTERPKTGSVRIIPDTIMTLLS
jgi:hypothetical protein